MRMDWGYRGIVTTRQDNLVPNLVFGVFGRGPKSGGWRSSVHFTAHRQKRREVSEKL